MSYLIELQTRTGFPAGYVLADANNPDEALASLHEQLGESVDADVVVLAVHTVH